MRKRRHSRGLGGVATSKDSLRSQAKACGSHYFDKDTMRFFNARLVNVVPVPAKNVTYFVESKGGGRWAGSVPRHYVVGVFKNCQVNSIGKGYGSGKASGTYKTSRQATKVARAIAKKASGGGATRVRRSR